MKLEAHQYDIGLKLETYNEYLVWKNDDELS